MLKGKGNTEQQVGGCLLDKVGAITSEDGIAKFQNDLQVDLAACCTKGNTAKCITDLSPAYSAIRSSDKSTAVKTILAAAKVRLGGAPLKRQAVALLHHASRE